MASLYLRHVGVSRHFDTQVGLARVVRDPAANRAEGGDKTRTRRRCENGERLHESPVIGMTAARQASDVRAQKQSKPPEHL